MERDPRWPRHPPGLPAGQEDLPIHPAMLTVTDELPGYRIVRSLGIARGNAHWSVQKGEDFEKARDTAELRMMEKAALLGGNAIVGVRYAGIGGVHPRTSALYKDEIECLVYGSAVLVEPTDTGDGPYR